jgi:vacuolar-type H+-ATPase subunit I/STV1
MAAKEYRRSDYGAWLIVIASIVGLAVSVYNYNSADSGITGTPGAMLVIVSTVLLLLAGFILGRDMGGGALRVVLAALCFLGILGTSLAGYLLESRTLMVTMALCLIGWFVRLLRPRPI